MDRVEVAVNNMLSAIEAPLYDVGVFRRPRNASPARRHLGRTGPRPAPAFIKYRNVRGCHIYIRPSGEHRFTVLDDLDEAAIARLSEDGFTPCAVVETSVGNFQAWLKHSAVLPKLVGTFAAQTLASRYNADPSAADWRRSEDLPASPTASLSIGNLTATSLSCVLRATADSNIEWQRPSSTRSQGSMKYGNRSARRNGLLSPAGGGRRISAVSLEQFRTSSLYQDRPAAADIAFCIAAYANGMTEDRIERALEDDFLAPDSSPSRRAAYIRRTTDKARRWIER